MADFLKALFGDGEALTYDQLMAKMTENKINAVNLASGGYVSQGKYDDRTGELNQQIKALQDQLTQRDTDMETLRTTLSEAQLDAGKLPGLQQSMKDLQDRYNADRENFAKQIESQKITFAIRERSSGLKFTSKAAKNEFLREAERLDLKLDGDTLLGYDDFVAKYKADNADSFVSEEPPTPDTDPAPTPQIVLPKGKPSGDPGNQFHFNFGGVRPH